MKLDLISTLAGTPMEKYLPAGWDMKKFDACCSHPPETITHRQRWWNKDFAPIPIDNEDDIPIMMGHDVAMEIKRTAATKRKLALILPVGAGFYRWLVYFLKSWNVNCKHVYGFTMDDWSDAEGNTYKKNGPKSFQVGMEESFYEPLGKLTVPTSQRYYTTRQQLPRYPWLMNKLLKQGARLVLAYGIGQTCHSAFWEPQLAADYKCEEEWLKQSYRLGMPLHPLTVQMEALHNFSSRITLVPACANTIGPGLFLKAHYAIGVASSTKAMNLWVTLRHQPDPWIPSTYVTTLSGKLYFGKAVAGPLVELAAARTKARRKPRQRSRGARK